MMMMMLEDFVIKASSNIWIRLEQLDAKASLGLETYLINRWHQSISSPTILAAIESITKR